MKAAWYERNGPARDVLTVGDVDTPEPAAGEVRVKLAASGVNPSDVKGRMGRPLPGQMVIPHSDGAGVIDAVGAGVTHDRINERVWIWNGQWKRQHGTAAEYICLPAHQAARLPGNVDFAAGACLGIPALTAVQAVAHMGQVGGKTLLVTGAGSAVGHYIVQIARHRGARVIGTASDQRAQHARAAGADFVVDYKHKDVTEVVKHMTRNEGVDGIIDMDLSSTANLIADAIVKPHGTIVCYGSNVPGDIPISFPAMLWNSYTLKVFLVYELTVGERTAAIAELTKMLEGGKLKHAVGARFPLRDIVAAHEAVEKGAVSGNVVLDIG
ncbi:MAG: NADPH:quinone reductase [Rhizobiaceae bacterium]|nr:NADPH:quinone reductase [Rhizobiaceae bacterium]